MTEQRQDQVEATQGATSAEAPQDFAATLEALERIVEQLESGNMPLEASLEAFEQGVKLTRDAQHRLEAAELKVKTLQTRADGSLEETHRDEVAR